MPRTSQPPALRKACERPAEPQKNSTSFRFRQGGGGTLFVQALAAEEGPAAAHAAATRGVPSVSEDELGIGHDLLVACGCSDRRAEEGASGGEGIRPLPVSGGAAGGARPAASPSWLQAGHGAPAAGVGCGFPHAEPLGSNRMHWCQPLSHLAPGPALAQPPGRENAKQRCCPSARMEAQPAKAGGRRGAKPPSFPFAPLPAAFPDGAGEGTAWRAALSAFFSALDFFLRGGSG